MLIMKPATVRRYTIMRSVASEEMLVQALICAAAKGKLKAVSVLVEQGAAVNYLTRTGRTGNRHFTSAWLLKFPCASID